MITFKEFIEFDRTLIESSMSGDKRFILVEIKKKYKEQMKNASLLYQLYNGVANGSITPPRARAILSQLRSNGYPNQFSDAHKLSTKPNFIPDGKLKIIRKPQLLGQNPDLSSYHQGEDGYYRTNN